MEVALINGLFVRMTGPPAGPTLILLHAFADSSQAFIPLFAMPLADRFRLVAVDLAGFGASPPSDNVHTIAEHAEAVAALVASLPTRGPVGLVAHSVTSMIAVEAVPRLSTPFAGLFSIEGNLTAQDAYFSRLRRSRGVQAAIPRRRLGYGRRAIDAAPVFCGRCTRRSDRNVGARA